MTKLTELKLTAAQKPTHISPVLQRRNKLVRRLWEQTEMAQALAAGTQYASAKLRTVLDKETGTRQQVQVNKRLKQWWFTADNGKVCLSVRYGTRVLELAKGKYAVEVGAEKDLVATLDVIKAAVVAGELDAAIETASTKLRSGFGK
jgi:hypothetical protein